jgi:hypothetical protein
MQTPKLPSTGSTAASMVQSPAPEPPSDRQVRTAAEAESRQTEASARPHPSPGGARGNMMFGSGN